MKKSLSCFLIVFTVIVAQLLSVSEVSAKSVKDLSNTYLNTANNRKTDIPKLVSVNQIAPNQIQISYDMDVDINLGTKATNYWVQDIKNVKPEYIATLGKKEEVTGNNSLTDSLVKINPKDGSAKTFILTFNQDIPKGKEFKLIICYVTVEGAPPYSGDNGAAIFVGR